MTKKHFVKMADAIREHNMGADVVCVRRFTPSQLDTLADFCQSQNPNFDRELWLGYIAGTRGPGGKYL